MEETQIGRKRKMDSLGFDSLLCQNFSKSYLHAFANALDFSSITEDSFIYKSLFEGNTNMITGWKFLQSTRTSQRWFWKDELKNKFIKRFMSTSPKQYIIEESIENTNQSSPAKQPAVLKVKGTKRNLVRKHISSDDFIRTIIKNEPSRKLSQHHIKRLKGKIYVHSQDKRILSCFTAKRIFSKKYFTESSAFGWPLHLKPYL